MLERHMDENTKAAMLEKVIAIDSVGLTYEQRGQVEHSKHFDMTPLITALQNYVDDLVAVSHLDEIRTADLTLSRTNLGLIEPKLDRGCVIS